MIDIKNISKEPPFLIFQEKYQQSIIKGQQDIEVACISSYSKKNNEVNARFVNLKELNNKDLIFFSNYKSHKAEDFESHSQVSVVIYWNIINLQIRIKANISKTSREFNLEYFKKRNKKKNALAISSMQSQKIESYKKVLDDYYVALKNSSLSQCPEYWGGYKLTPYYFEFWEGHNSRINKRYVYELNNKDWIQYVLQP